MTDKVTRLDELSARKHDDAQYDVVEWPQLVDPFSDYPLPAFPLDVLPNVMQDYASEHARQSGFDAGGYGFCTFISAANNTDHRIKLDVGPFKQPGYFYGGLVSPSGGGKTPVLNVASAPSRTIEDGRTKTSQKELAEWKMDVEKAKANRETPPECPQWRQRIALDITTEALGKVLMDNPSGVNLYHHELTEFLGRMDAYAGKDGGKDRGVFLRAYDGGSVTINRAGRQSPLVVPNFSVGILAGIQPEVLAKKFRTGGGGADGLYQRFMLYCMKEAGDVDYFAQRRDYTTSGVQNIFNKLNVWNYDNFLINLDGDAKYIVQKYHQSLRTIAKRTTSRRFSEHLEKFPGMMVRAALALHQIHAAANGTDPRLMVTPEITQKAYELMSAAYWHSEAVYRILDQEAADIHDLMRNAAEAILAKGWDDFKRGDLTRDATHWRNADNREAEAAIDLLIELGWIADITPEQSGGRGRRSKGYYLVNPVVHRQFQGQAERIAQMRSERYEALQIAAGKRRSE